MYLKVAAFSVATVLATVVGFKIWLVFHPIQVEDAIEKEMRAITKKRIAVAYHNHEILLQLWNDRCSSDPERKLPICANGPPEIMP